MNNVCFNLGINLAEALNFGTERWLREDGLHAKYCHQTCPYRKQDFIINVQKLGDDIDRKKRAEKQDDPEVLFKLKEASPPRKSRTLEERREAR